MEHLPTFWLIIAIFSGIAEILLPSFGAIFISFAAMIVAGIALIPGIIWQYQALLFSIILLFSLVYLRPKMLAKMQKSKGVPNITDSLVGKFGIITTAIDPVSGMGRALIDGQDWSIKCEDSLIENSKVIVIGSQGIVLTVKKTH